MTIRAVLWDFGGVITSSPFEAFNRYEAEHGIDADFIRRVNATNPDNNAWALMERNEVTLDEFDVAFGDESEALGHRIPGRDVLALLSGDLRPAMVAALEACKEHFKIGCITNNVAAGEGPGMARSREKAEKIADVMSLFEVIVESSKVGLRKPDPAIYQLACQKLDVSPGDCVYLDDLGINLKPARALGMTTIKVVDPRDALCELSRATGLDLV